MTLPAAPERTADTKDAEVAALVALAAANIPTDVQELLAHGDPGRGIAPGALRKACDAYHSARTK